MSDILVNREELAALVRNKEKELYEFHQMRCDLLEKVIKERDGLLLEASKRFDHLRDDFQYNLSLLEARDSEIKRLDEIVKQSAQRIVLLETEKRALAERCDGIIAKDEERNRQIQEEKANNKAKVLQLKQEIENLGWATSEENKAKSREIESLKADLMRITLSQHETLDRQRSELTRIFEKRAEETTEEFSRREREISHQIVALDERFEQLKTENLRLKALGNESQRRVEVLTDEVAAKDTLLRQWMWQMEDERKNKLQNEDVVARQVSKLTNELNALREISARDSEEFKRTLEKCYKDKEKETEFRKMTESQLEESRQQYQQHLLSLESELHLRQQQIDQLHVDSNRIRLERDSALDRCSSIKVDLDANESKNACLSKQCAALQSDLSVAINRISQLEGELTDALRQAAEAINTAEQSAHEEVLAASAVADNAIAANQRQNDDELEQVRAAMKALNDQMISELQYENDKKVAEIESKNRKLNIENDSLRGELYERENEIKDLREELAALGLRLKLYDGHNRGSGTSSNGNGFRQSLGSDSGFGFAFGNNYAAHNDNNNNHYNNNNNNTVPLVDVDVESLHSSWDQGVLSLPDSPVPTPFANNHNNNNNNNNSSRATLSSIRPVNSNQQQRPPQPQQPHTPIAFGQNTAIVDEIMGENARLKEVIKEMRSNMQHLIVAQSAATDNNNSHNNNNNNNNNGNNNNSSSGSNSNGDVVQSELEDRCALLQQRLDSTINEVTRLRADRRRLMDVSNELLANARREVITIVATDQRPASAGRGAPASGSRRSNGTGNSLSFSASLSPNPRPYSAPTAAYSDSDYEAVDYHNNHRRSSNATTSTTAMQAFATTTDLTGAPSTSSSAAAAASAAGSTPTPISATLQAQDVHVRGHGSFGAAQRGLHGHGAASSSSASAGGVGSTASSRTTLSQLQARQRLARMNNSNNSSRFAVSSSSAKPVNYATHPDRNRDYDSY